MEKFTAERVGNGIEEMKRFRKKMNNVNINKIRVLFERLKPESRNKLLLPLLLLRQRVRGLVPPWTIENSMD